MIGSLIETAKINDADRQAYIKGVLETTVAGFPATQGSMKAGRFAPPKGCSGWDPSVNGTLAPDTGRHNYRLFCIDCHHIRARDPSGALRRQDDTSS